MTFNPLLNFPRPHKVGDWIKDLDGRTTREPHSTLSLRSHKILHRIPEPRDEFGPFQYWDLECAGHQEEWVQSKQKRLWWFPVTFSRAMRMNIRRLAETTSCRRLEDENIGFCLEILRKLVRMHEYGPRPDPGELSKWCWKSACSLSVILPSCLVNPDRVLWSQENL